MISRILWGLIILNTFYLPPLLAADTDFGRAFISSSGQATISVVIPYRVEKIRADLANPPEQTGMLPFYVKREERLLHNDSTDKDSSVIFTKEYQANRFKQPVRIKTEIFYPQ